MSRSPRIPALALAAVAAVLAAPPTTAQERQVYRYTDADGKVIYSDRPPAGEAKGVQQKRFVGNTIETSEAPYATRIASRNFPVTLYTFDCGEPCRAGEALLNARGVPFAKVNVQEPDGLQKLKNLTGEMSAPALQVGDKSFAKGFNAEHWQAMLDEAGYPKAVPKRATGKSVEPPVAGEARAEPAGATAALTPQGVTQLPEPRTPYPSSP